MQTTGTCERLNLERRRKPDVNLVGETYLGGHVEYKNIDDFCGWCSHELDCPRHIDDTEPMVRCSCKNKIYTAEEVSELRKESKNIYVVCEILNKMFNAYEALQSEFGKEKSNA